ncbi:MAG TPA: radical SAM protein [Pirellulales bacterium]|nr:radical SAM protein [Pirellulales bacterium]
MKLPEYLQLEPVGQCNLRCQMCAIQFRQDGPSNGSPAFMEFETFVRIVEQFPALKHLHLQGLGEPMMHPRFFDMAAHAASRGIRVTTNSNMTLLSTEKRAARCATCGLDCIHVSIDGATPESYARIRKQGRLQRVIRNLDLLVNARAQAGGARPELRLVTVVMRQNLHELPDLVRLAARWSVRSMFVQHLCHDFSESTLPDRYLPMRQFVDQQTLLGEDLQSIETHFSAARSAAAECGIELRLPTLGGKAGSAGAGGGCRCDWPWSGAYISYDGSAMPCCMISTPDRLNFGNYKREDASTLWNSRDYQTFRDRLASDDPHELCRSCSVYHGVF